MTLVFGYTENERVHLHADSQISDGLGGRSDVVPGRLKVLVLRDDLCVGYAGSSDLALKHLRTLALGLSATLPPAEVEHRLLAAHLETDCAVEFLLACTSGPPLLRKIADGSVAHGATQYWIGDARAAAELAKLEQSSRYSRLPIPEAHRKSSIRHFAFQELLNNQAVSSVGGLAISARASAGRFSYVDMTAAFSAPQTFPGPGSWVVKFGTAADGGYAYSIMAPVLPGVPLVAAYFPQGRLGYVYSPLQFDEPVLYENVSYDGLVLFVRAHFGFEIVGPPRLG